MIKERLADLLGEIAGKENIKLDEPMKYHTSFRVGGSADIIVIPRSAAALSGICRLCRQMQISLFVMGNGTNLVVRDKGIRGVVVKMTDNFSSWEIHGNVLRAQAGILISRLAKVAQEHGLAGLEFAEGIPGTLGGAVCMNAGAYGGEMADVVIKTEYMDDNGDIRILNGDEHRFGKRTSRIQMEGGIVVTSEMLLQKGDPTVIKGKMAEFRRARCEKQPLDLPSAGSVFKRPEGYFAGKLIQDCGLRGYRLGGAQVSEKHCGFIVNTGNATAKDITGLIDHIRNTVFDRFHVELQPEVRIIGEE